MVEIVCGGCVCLPVLKVKGNGFRSLPKEGLQVANRHGSAPSSQSFAAAATGLGLLRCAPPVVRSWYSDVCLLFALPAYTKMDRTHKFPHAVKGPWCTMGGTMHRTSDLRFLKVHYD